MSNYKHAMRAAKARLGLTNKQIAEATGQKTSYVGRLLSLNTTFSPNLAQLERVAEVLGVEIVFRQKE